MRLYNAADVDLCYEIYLEMAKGFPSNELALIDLTVRMFAEPVMKVDMKRAKAELKLEKANRKRTLQSAGVPKKDLMSSDRLADHLHAAGLDPPRKISARTKKLAWAFAKTDQEFTALARHPNPVIAALVKARLVIKSTINETRAARLMNAGRHRKRVPVYLNYCGAHTTRWSGGDKLNFQNFPRGGELRKSLLAPAGHVIVVVDSRQIECRMLAWLAGEKWLLDEFAKPDGDPYCAFASIAYGRTITVADKDERFVGKTCVLGLGYSMAALKLQAQLANKGVYLSLEVCENLVAAYRSANLNIVDLWDILALIINDMATEGSGTYGPLSWDGDRILLPNGLALHYPDVQCTVYKARSRVGTWRERVADGSYMTVKGRAKLYGGLLTENVVQALSRVAVGEQMLPIAERYRVVMMSHDEVAYVAPVKKAEEALQFGIDTLRIPPAWAPDLPLDAEGGFDRMYSK
jgi:DNA polymerase